MMLLTAISKCDFKVLEHREHDCLPLIKLMPKQLPESEESVGRQVIFIICVKKINLPIELLVYWSTVLVTTVEVLEFHFSRHWGGEGRRRGKKWGWGGEWEEERRGESWTKHTSLSNFMGYLPSICKHWISIVYSMFNSLLCPFFFALPPSCCLNVAAPWILSPRPPW